MTCTYPVIDTWRVHILFLTDDVYTSCYWHMTVHTLLLTHDVYASCYWHMMCTHLVIATWRGHILLLTHYVYTSCYWCMTCTIPGTRLVSPTWRVHIPCNSCLYSVNTNVLSILLSSETWANLGSAFPIWALVSDGILPHYILVLTANKLLIMYTQNTGVLAVFGCVFC